jgi:transcriptional regulator with XRE-family HTH domain
LFSYYLPLMTENQRLKILMQKLGFKTQASFADAIELKPGTLSDILRQKSGVGVSAKTKRILEKSYNVNIDWLENGIGPITNPTIEAEPLYIAADPTDPDNNGEKFEELPNGLIRMRVKIVPQSATKVIIFFLR